MKKYKATTGYSPSIEIIECEKETEKCVFINGRKANKISSYESYFDDFELAKSHIVKYCSYHLEAAQRRLKYEKDRYGNAIGLKESEVKKCT